MTSKKNKVVKKESESAKVPLGDYVIDGVHVNRIWVNSFKSKDDFVSDKTVNEVLFKGHPNQSDILERIYSDVKV